MAYLFKIFTRIKFPYKNKHNDNDDDDDDDDDGDDDDDDDDDDDNDGLFRLSLNPNEGDIAVHGFMAAPSGLCACVKCWLSRCCPSAVNALLPYG